MPDVLALLPQLRPRREARGGGARRRRDHDVPPWLRHALQAQDDRHLPRPLPKASRLGLDRLRDLRRLHHHQRLQEREGAQGALRKDTRKGAFGQIFIFNVVSQYINSLGRMSSSLRSRRTSTSAARCASASSPSARRSSSTSRCCTRSTSTATSWGSAGTQRKSSSTTNSLLARSACPNRRSPSRPRARSTGTPRGSTRRRP